MKAKGFDDVIVTILYDDFVLTDGQKSLQKGTKRSIMWAMHQIPTHSDVWDLLSLPISHALKRFVTVVVLESSCHADKQSHSAC